MPTQRPLPPSATLTQRLLRACCLLRSRGYLLDGLAHSTAMRTPGTAAPAQPTSAGISAEGLALFVIRLQELLAATTEPMRQQLENEVLDLAVPLHAAGMFEILNIAHPAAAAMISDHLTKTVSQR